MAHLRRAALGLRSPRRPLTLILVLRRDILLNATLVVPLVETADRATGH